jgi:hypothetical protein
MENGVSKRGSLEAVDVIIRATLNMHTTQWCQDLPVNE